MERSEYWELPRAGAAATERRAARRIVTAALISMGVTAAALSGYESREELEVMAREATPQEEYLVTTLHEGGITDGSRVWLDCRDDDSPDFDGGNYIMGYVEDELYTDITIPVIHMRRSLCDSAVQYAAGDKSNPTTAQVYGVQTLLHEAFHIVADSGDEAEVECYTAQKTGELAAAMGADEAEASRMEELSYDMYHNDLLPEYQDPDCYDEGPYDLEPGAAGFFPYPVRPVA